MISPVTVLIIEPNQYFALGFTQAIMEHFKDLRVAWVFSRTFAAKDYADLVFLSAEQEGAHLRYLTQRHTAPRHQRIFMFKDKPGRGDNGHYPALDGVFYRHQSLDWAMQIVTQGLCHVSLMRARQRGPLPRQRPLTEREIEVLRSLAHGQRSCDISRALHISQKTVSGHKRNAMAKLGISRSSDLNYWLLRDRISQLTAHWPSTEWPAPRRRAFSASEAVTRPLTVNAD